MARASWILGLSVEVRISVCLVSTAIFEYIPHHFILVLTDKYATLSSLLPLQNFPTLDLRQFPC
jgi:hypothetical protein